MRGLGPGSGWYAYAWAVPLSYGGDACPDFAGNPVFHGVALDGSLGYQCEVHRRALNRMRGLPSRNVLILLRLTFCASRLNYLLARSPCFERTDLVRLDGLHVQRTGMGYITNCSISDLQWLKAIILPLKGGGFGVRVVVSLAPSA